MVFLWFSGNDDGTWMGHASTNPLKCWDMLGYVGICRDMLGYVGICWDMSGYVGICRDMLGMFRKLYMLTEDLGANKNSRSAHPQNIQV